MVLVLRWFLRAESGSGLHVYFCSGDGSFAGRTMPETTSAPGYGVRILWSVRCVELHMYIGLLVSCHSVGRDYLGAYQINHKMKIKFVSISYSGSGRICCFGLSGEMRKQENLSTM